MASQTLTLLSLPAELRQRILLLSLPLSVTPATLPQSHPSIFALSWVCTTLHADARSILSLWSPTYGFPTPSLFQEFLSALSKIRTTEPSYRGLVQAISWSLFHDAEADTMHWTCYCGGPSYRTHFELIKAWIDVVPLVPASVKAVELDVTPAPGWMRAQRPDWIPSFLQDKRVAKTFVSEHKDIIVALIKRLTARGIAVSLKGLLSEKSQSFLNAMIETGAEEGIDIVFTGEMLPLGTGRKGPRLGRAMRSLAPVRWGWILASQPNDVEGEGSFDRLPPRNELEACAARLGTVNWSADTERLWSGDEWCMGILRRFVAFAASEKEETELEPVNNRRRALLHHIAQDLGFKTASAGEEPERSVRVFRSRGG